MKNLSLPFVLAASLFFPLFGVSAKPAPVAPENMKEYETNVGKSYHFTLTGKTDGSIWGTNVYTTDSSLSTAAVHAGIVKAGETDDVEVMVVAGMDSYAGSQKNGVSSGDWKSYGASYKFVKKSGDEAPASKLPEAAGKATADTSSKPAKKIKDTPENLTDYEKQVGQSFIFTVTGAIFGTVYGSGPYTTDSNLSTAAVHAGLVKAGAEADVEVVILPAQESFTGTMNHGITSNRWPVSHAAFKFVEKK